MKHKKKISLERRVIPERISGFFARFYGYEWRRYRRYETTEQAVQSFHDVTKSSWNRDFEWRIHTQVGYVSLPVVKA